MHELKPPWPPPAPWPPPVALVPPVTRRDGWVRALLVVVLLVGGGALTQRWGGAVGSQHPKAWDPRVEPLARFVETTRGLQFRYPVRVDFLSEDEFLAHVRAGGAAPVELAMTDTSAELPLERAFGLVPRSFERAKATSDAAAGVVGAYDPDEERIRVRGESMTVAVRVTLVHELTHALQDQVFALDRVRGSSTTRAGAAAVLAVIEGDASTVERRYAAELTAAERDSYARETSGVASSDELSRVPGALLATIEMPYALGPAFVQTVDRAGGASRRDDLFRLPPTNDLELLFPELQLDGWAGPTRPAPPVLASGEVEIGARRFGDDLGAFGWLTILAGRLDVHDAVRAVQEWGGDRYVTFRRDGAVCARASVVASSNVGAHRLEDALGRWIDAGPSGSASKERSGTTFTLTSCDTGLQDPPTDGRYGAALTLLAIRDEALSALTPFGRDDLTTAQRVCIGDATSGGLTLDELQRPDQLTAARIHEVGRNAMLSCGVSAR